MLPHLIRAVLEFGLIWFCFNSQHYGQAYSFIYFFYLLWEKG